LGFARQSVERIADAELRKARLRTLVAVAAAFVFLAIGFTHGGNRTSP